MSKDELIDVRCVALAQGSWYKMEVPLEDKDNENSCLHTYFEAGAFQKDDLK